MSQLLIPVAWAVAVLSMALLAYAHYQYALDAYWSSRHSSRFRMFAARDHLVYLIASGQMDESDATWQEVYAATNSLLDLSRKLTVWGVVRNRVAFERRLENDPGLRERVRKTDRELGDACKRTPEFAHVLHEIDVGTRLIISGQTPRWQFLAMRAAVFLLSPLARWSRGRSPSPAQAERPAVDPAGRRRSAAESEDRRRSEAAGPPRARRPRASSGAPLSISMSRPGSTGEIVEWSQQSCSV